MRRVFVLAAALLAAFGAGCGGGGGDDQRATMAAWEQQAQAAPGGLAKEMYLPSVTSVTPSSIPVNTRLTITITGTNFTDLPTGNGRKEVIIGNYRCRDVVFVNSTTITATTPPVPRVSTEFLYVANTYGGSQDYPGQQVVPINFVAP